MKKLEEKIFEMDDDKVTVTLNKKIIGYTVEESSFKIYEIEWFFKYDAATSKYLDLIEHYKDITDEETDCEGCDKCYCGTQQQ